MSTTYEHRGYTIERSGYGYNPWHVVNAEGEHLTGSNSRSIKGCRAWIDRQLDPPPPKPQPRTDAQERFFQASAAVMVHLKREGAATAEEMAEAEGLDVGDVNRALEGWKRRANVRRRGRAWYWFEKAPVVAR